MADIGNIKGAFEALPVAELISNPFKAAQEAQNALTGQYLDTVYRLAYDDNSETRLLTLDLERPTTDSETGFISSQSVQVKAPILGLVPIPSLLITNIVVDFTMEVKTSEQETDKSEGEVTFGLEGKFWRSKYNFKASSKSSEERIRSTDQSATYTVHVEANQQEPVEGMNKLMDIISSVIEPIAV